MKPLHRVVRVADETVVGERVTRRTFRGFLGGRADLTTIDVSAGPVVTERWTSLDGERALLVVRGDVVLEWIEGDRTASVRLEPRLEHRVASRVRHRLVSPGGLVESYVPSGGAEPATEWSDA